ncbi:hypothetical protein [Janthinobacterium lividum]|uniref:hypothetical protein n=1 Tax=Janthinobacterium lividum TaxID=29581 RepID=UPI001595C9BC|nr:hypothetical protein [Janthinobacterium lividum]QKY08794.1 hypothetical protein G8765_14220 [Janthinobacterium lividum]
MNIDFSPEKSLFNLQIVRWCAGISAALALIVTFTIIYSLRNLPFDFTSSGFNYFAELYKVPAALLAIGFTLVGLCAANHRSEQTKKQIERTANQIDLTNKQIELTKIQNNFSNYYKHIEEFEKYCKDHENYDKYAPEPRKIYRLIFSKSNSKSELYEINQDFVKDLDVLILSVTELAKSFEKEYQLERHVSGYKIYSLIQNFKKNTFIRIHHTGTGADMSSPQGSFILDQGSWRTFFSNYVLLITIIDTLLKFDLSYESSVVVKDAMQLNLDSIPAAGGIRQEFSLSKKSEAQNIIDTTSIHRS